MTTTPPQHPGPTLDPDELTLEAIRAGALAGRPVSVLGFARSGIALARFLVDAGAIVTVYDRRPVDELAEALARLDGRPVRLLAGPLVEPAKALDGAALVATSPSVNPDYPTTEPRLRAALAALVAARTAGDPLAPAIVSEPDLVLRLCPAPTIGISGTKGKTTTSALAHALLAADLRHRAILGGNIGRPLVERLADLRPDDRVVIELSELQLPTLSRGTTVAVLTNVTSDHLDRHGTLEAYRAVKRRFAQAVDPTGALVLNLDDPVVAGYVGLGSARVVGYRLDGPPPGGVGVADGWIVADAVERLDLAGGGPAATGPEGRIVPLAELTLPGRHNLSNTLAAVAVALLFGVPPAAIRSAAAAFVGVEHRLETVAVVDGIRFVNDSQGT
ncbi:MAG: Mur ligase family protein, partial [Candidatus Limnocylindrales bacterium]